MRTVYRRRMLGNGRLAAVWVLLCALPATSTQAAPEDLVRAATELKARYAAQIRDLAAWCDGRGLKEQAQKTRAALGPHDPYKIYLPVLPREVGPPPLPQGVPADVVEWDARWNRLRHEQGMALFELARRAVSNRRASLGYELVIEAVRVDPDCEPARRVLGYQKFRDGWHTPYEVRKLRVNQVWHEKFGWISQANVRRYEEGQRPAGKRWITVAEDARIHARIESGWDVETEHYAIRTNHSLEAGVALGAKLERLYHVWEQLFIRYYASEAHVLALFEGRARPPAQPAKQAKLAVVYYRDRDDYNRSLRAVPGIEQSIGYFNQAMRQSHFFAGKDADDRTLYHEATHQLFQQSRPVVPDVGAKANFWIVEGIAMYMESLHQEGAYYVLGGADDERMQDAQVRLLRDNFYVPLAEATRYSMEKIQKDPRIATLYSQFAGQANFLVYYEGGRYRDALVAYLTAVYTGRADPNTLAQLTGTSYGELDKQYREFIAATAKLAGAQQQ